MPVDSFWKPSYSRAETVGFEGWPRQAIALYDQRILRQGRERGTRGGNDGGVGLREAENRNGRDTTRWNVGFCL